MPTRNTSHTYHSAIALGALAVLLLASCRFQGGQRAEETWLPAAMNGVWGYVDLEGNWRIPPQYTLAAPFAEGLAPVANAQGLWGYVTPEGRIAMVPTYRSAGQFAQGLAPVVDANGNVLYINPEGDTVFTPEHADAAGCFSPDGVAPVRKAGRWGFIRRDGTWAVEPKFSRVRPLSNEMWVVFGPADSAAGGERWGAVRANGQVAIPCKFKFLDSFSEGLAVASDDGRLLGYVLPDGRYSILPQFEEARVFGAGMAAVRLGDMWGYVRTNGRLHILPQFAQAGDFGRNGFAAVRLKSGEWGLIGTEGQFIARPQFEMTNGIWHELVLFRFRGRWGAARRTGTVAINPDFEAFASSADDWQFVFANARPTTQAADNLLSGLAEGQWGNLAAGSLLADVLQAMAISTEAATASTDRYLLRVETHDTLSPCAVSGNAELQFTAPPVSNRPRFEGVIENGQYIRTFAGYERSWNYGARLRAVVRWVECNEQLMPADTLAAQIIRKLQTEHGARLSQVENGVQLYTTPRMRYWLYREANRVGLRVEFADLDEAESPYGIRS